MKRTGYVAGILAFAATILYFVSMATYVYPGESALLAASWSGLDVVAEREYPLMAFFAKLLGGGNVIAPLCGAIAVACLFCLVKVFVAWRIGDGRLQLVRDEVATVAGAVAAVVFMLTPGVRSAATHLEPRMFEFAWAALALSLSIPCFRGLRGGFWLYPVVAGAFAGLGLMDSGIFVAFAPFYLTVVTFVAYENQRKPYLPLFLFVLTVGVSFAAGASACGLSPVDLLAGAGKEVQSYIGVPGWVFVAIFTTLPFVTTLFSSAKAFRDAPELVPWIFHCAMTFVAVLAIATPLSPSALMEPYAVTPVATSAFAAAVAGYLAAYWWANRKAVVALVSGGLLAFVLAVTVVWNLFSFDGDIGAFADKVADKIIDDLGERQWFVTDGVLDSHLMLRAAERGKKLHIVSLTRDLDESYLVKLGELIKKEGVGGSKNGALQLSASLGVLPFIQDWFASDPSAAKDVAIFGAPDLWYSAGQAPVPEFFFFGADPARKSDWSAWKEFDKILKAPKGWGSYHDRNQSNPVDRMRLSLRRHLGFVANNRGVYLQDQKKDDAAFDMYELVLNGIDRDNICAIFNEVGMIGQKHAGATAKKRDLEKMLKNAVEDKNRRYLLWRLGTYYGYVRNPDTFVRLGYAWARSGRPGDALSQIRRAIDFVPTDKRSVLLNMMASLYASENEQQKSRQIYESLLNGNSKDHDALVGMMRLELLAGNSQKALEYLQRAAEAAGGGKRANIELAMVAMMKNDLPKAKGLIKKVTDADPKDMQAWSLLAAVTMQQIDSAQEERAKKALLKELKDVILPTMEKQSRDAFDYYLQATKGFVLLREGEESRAKARDAFLAAAKARPDIAATQNMVLGLDISLDDKANAEVHARDVLRRNRNAPLANYVMGSIALGRGKYDEAEAFLRKAADAPQPVALALNDLAEVMRRNKNLVEAERYARKATEAAPGLYVAWETLGSVLMDADRNLDEAEAAIRKACQLSKDKDGKEADIRMLVSLARVQVRNKDMQHARLTVRKVQARLAELSEFERREFEKVEKSVR